MKVNEIEKLRNDAVVINMKNTTNFKTVILTSFSLVKYKTVYIVT